MLTVFSTQEECKTSCQETMPRYTANSQQAYGSQRSWLACGDVSVARRLESSDEMIHRYIKDKQQISTKILNILYF